MANKVLNSRLQLKHDTAANWSTSTLVLLAGELAFETSTTSDYPVTDYTHSDQFSQFRLSGAGAIWFGKIEAGTMTY